MQFGNVNDLMGTAKRLTVSWAICPPTAATMPLWWAGISAHPRLKRAFPGWPDQPIPDRLRRQTV